MADSNVWVSLGPVNGAVVPIPGFPALNNTSGRANSIAVHPTIAGTIYLGTSGGGVWKTTDGGKTWIPLTDSIATLTVGALAIAPSAPDTIYLGTGDPVSLIDNTQGFGLLKSTDGGQTWQFPTSVIADSFYKISVNPTNAQDIVAATNRGGFHSMDGGATWTKVISPQTQDLVRDPTNPGRLFAATRFPTNVLKSTDDGVTWVIKNSGVLNLDSLPRMSITLSPSNPQILYLGFEDSSVNSHIYKSMDGGESWVERPLVDRAGNFQGCYLCGQGYYDNTIITSPTDPNTVIAGGIGFVLSRDGGTTWSRPPFTPIIHSDTHDLQYQGTTLYIANDGGLFSTSDVGETANDVGLGLVTHQYYSIETDPNDYNRILAGSQDNGLSIITADGKPATIFGGFGDVFDCRINPFNSLSVYISQTVQGNLVRCGPDLNTCVQINPTYPAGERGTFPNVLTVDPRNPSILYVTSNIRVWRTINGGTSWSPLPIATTDGSQWASGQWDAGGGGRVTIAGGNSNVIMANSMFGMFRSENGGTSWVLVSNSLPQFLGTVEIDPSNDKIVYVGTIFPSSAIYMTKDGGKSWKPTTTGLPAGMVARVIRVDPSNSNTVYCGTDMGVFRTTDQGLTWARFGADLPNVSVTDLRITGDGSIIRIATFGRGVWELRLPVVSNNPPTATISNPASAIAVAAGTTVTFQGVLSDPDAGDSVTGTWYFGDTMELIPTSSNAPSVTHTFMNKGAFQVTLTAKDSHGASAQAAVTVRVPEPADSCATPLIIPSSGPFPFSATLVKDGATTDPSDPIVDPNPCIQVNGSPTTKTFWFEFTPAVTGSYLFSAQSSRGPFEVISVWSGPKCGPYSLVSVVELCSGQHTPLVAGQTVRIMANSVLTDDTGTLTFTVNLTSDPISIQANVNGPVCPGKTAKFTATTIVGAQYQWTGPNGFLSNNQNPSLVATPSAAGVYTVTATASGMTLGTVTATLAVNPAPDPPVIAAPNSAIALQTGLTASVTNHPGSTYLWSITNGTITAGQGTNQIIFDVGNTAATVLQVTETNQIGCGSAQSSITIPVSPPSPATVVTLPVANVGVSSATLNGSVNSNGFPATAHFEWSSSSNLSAFNVTPDQPVSAASTAQNVNTGISGLTPGTAYFYRVVGVNAAGTAKGDIATFTTLNPVPVLSNTAPAATSLRGPALTLTVNGSAFLSNSTVNFNGSPRTTRFVSSAQLMADLTTDDLAAAGAASITVSNPAPGGGTSNSVTLTVNKGMPVISWSNPADIVFGTLLGSAQLNATVSYNGQPVAGGLTYSPAAGTGLNAGVSQPLTVIFAPTDAANFDSATGHAQINVLKAQATLQLGTLNFTYDGAAKGVTVITSPPDLTGVTVTYNGSPQPPSDAGSYAVIASLANQNYQATQAKGTLVIAKADQAITFDALPDKFNSDPPFTPGAIASSGLSLTFTATGSVTVVGSLVTITDVGSATITASQAGNGNFNPALPVTRTFNITNAVPTITRLSPSIPVVNSGAFTLDIQGTGFTAKSAVMLNGAPRITTLVNSFRLQAAILANDIAALGTATIVVVNPAPGGGSSSPATLTIGAFRYGDLNSDGAVDASDLVLMANFLAGNVQTLPNQAAADVFQDGVINSADLVTLANFLAGNIEDLPVTQPGANILESGLGIFRREPVLEDLFTLGWSALNLVAGKS